MYDYSVTLNTGEEQTGLTWAEAKSLAAKYKELDPYIDQFYKGDEHTDTYWHYVNGKLVKEK